MSQIQQIQITQNLDISQHSLNDNAEDRTKPFTGLNNQLSPENTKQSMQSYENYKIEAQNVEIKKVVIGNQGSAKMLDTTKDKNTSKIYNRFTLSEKSMFTEKFDRSQNKIEPQHSENEKSVSESSEYSDEAQDEKIRFNRKKISKKTDITTAIDVLQNRIVSSFILQNQSVEDPIEIYEIKLYELTKFHKQELNSKMLDYRSIDLLHHIHSLKFSESVVLNEEEQKIVDKNFSIVLQDNPTALKEYKFLLSCIDFFSAMIIKFKFITIEDYKYRLSRTQTNLKFIDLLLINRDIQTPEIYWHAANSLQMPMKILLSFQCKRYAKKMINDFMQLCGFALRLNNDIDFEHDPEIYGIIAAKNKKLARIKGWFPNKEGKLNYQQLTNTNVFQRFFCQKANTKAIKFKDLLRQLEESYRKFESTFLNELRSIAEN